MQSLRDPLFKQRKGRSTEFCLCFIFALLMIATSVEGRFGCFFDEDCRRDVCVFNICVSRPKTTKTCEFNSNCFYSATESCIFSACTPRSSTGGPCDDDEDCSVKGDLCSEQQCSFSAPLDPLLMLSDGNKAPSTTHSNGAGVVVNGRLFVFAGQGSKSTEVFDPATNTWTSKADVPIVCFGHTVAAVEDFVFLIGGNDDGFNVFTTFFRYDTVNDVWETDWPALPEARTRAAAASVGSVVFLFGGANSGNTLRNTILSFDVSSKSNTWTIQKAVFPAATASVSATTIGTDIFLTGGTKAIGGALSRALKYDTQLPDANPSVLSDMLQIREQHSSFYNPSDMRLYALGGESLSAQNTVEYYDTTQAAPGTWVSANAPNYDLIYAASAGLIGSRFYLTGSYYSSQVLQVLDISVPSSIKWSPFPNSPSPKASVFQLTGPSTITAVDTVFRSVAFYNTVSDAWTVGPASFPNSGISNAASAFSSGQLFIMGGYDGESAITNVYALNSAGDSWSFKTSMPEPRIGSCAAASGSQIFLYGGASTSLFVLDTLADSGNGVWRKVPDGSVTPTGVSNCAAVVSGSKLLIFGGSDINAAPTGLIQSFDITQDKWDAPLAATITPRSGLSAVLLKGFVFVIGGTADSFSGLSTVEAFDIATKTVAALKDLPTPRYALGSVTDGTSIFAVGGKVAGGNFPSLERIRSP